MYAKPLEQFRSSRTAVRWEGGAEAGMDISFFATDHPKGIGPGLHVHPYAEVFVVLGGTAEFTAGDEQQLVEAGHVVVVPPETPHRFESRGEDNLRIVSIHPSPTVVQTDLE